jgi:hypothetical protein
MEINSANKLDEERRVDRGIRPDRAATGSGDEKIVKRDDVFKFSKEARAEGSETDWVRALVVS